MKTKLLMALALIAVAAAGGAALGAPCDDKAAIPTGGGGSTSTPDNMSCGDGSSCGGTTTYNPLVTVCQAVPTFCCKPQIQYSYTSRRSCSPDPQSNPPTTTCKTTYTQNSGPVVVFVSVACADGVCGEVPPFTPPGTRED